MPSHDLQTFKELFLLFYPEMVRTALFYVHDTDIAEDIVEDIFVRLWEKQRLPDVSNIRAYLRQSVRNSCLNHMEHRLVEDRYQQEYLAEREEEQVPSEEYLRLVSRLLEDLPPKRRLVLELSVARSKSYREIAQELDISVNTVKDHIKKAYAYLREAARKEITRTILLIVLKRRSLC